MRSCSHGLIRVHCSRMDGSGHTCTPPVRRRLLAAALSASSSSLPLLVPPQPPNPASAQGSSHSLPTQGRPRCAPQAALWHGAGASGLPTGLSSRTRGVAGCDDAQQEVEELVGRGAASAGPAEGCRLSREPSDGRSKCVSQHRRAPALLHSGIASSGAAHARLSSSMLGGNLQAPEVPKSGIQQSSQQQVAQLSACPEAAGHPQSGNLDP